MIAWDAGGAVGEGHRSSSSRGEGVMGATLTRRCKGHREVEGGGAKRAAVVLHMCPKADSWADLGRVMCGYVVMSIELAFSSFPPDDICGCRCR